MGWSRIVLGGAVLLSLCGAAGCGRSAAPLPPPGPSETATLTQEAVNPRFEKFRATQLAAGPGLTLAELEKEFGPSVKRPELVAGPTGEPLAMHFWTNEAGRLEVGVEDCRVRTMAMSNLRQP